MKIALIVNFDKGGAFETARKITDYLRSLGAEVLFMHGILADCYEDAQAFGSRAELIRNSDVVLTVGGDGTIIHTAKFAVVCERPILGVNLGRLGYVAELEANEISMLKRLVDGDYTIAKRSVLSVSIISPSKVKRNFFAVNDAVIARGSLSRIIDLQVSVDGDDVKSYRADGLLVSTPTGSTAYALSAGGPVISPDLKCIEVVPVCPHSLSARCVILSPDSVIRIKAQSPDDEIYLTIDGQISEYVSEDDVVEIKNAEYTLDMIVLKERNFYKLAGEKLNEVN